MKIHILYPLIDGPWGGANQFLKAIKEYFVSIGVYENNINQADVILFNSSPTALLSMLNEAYRLKQNFNNKLFINRIDGPVFLIRGKNILIDKAFYLFNDYFCDGTIFQSAWSKKNNQSLGMRNNQFETTILNAPNIHIFNQDHKVPFDQAAKTRLIATSWSSNWKKGFETYKWLDENLDFMKYEMTFIGNSPVAFKNIHHILPMNSEELSKELKRHDIFITASESDPCSNSLIEALHCGLPAIAIDDGGHTEIIANGGEVFSTKKEIFTLLEKISSNYEFYQQNIYLKNINTVGEEYYHFLENTYTIKKDEGIMLKQPTLLQYFQIKFYIFLWLIEEKSHSFKTKVLGQLKSYRCFS